jgi:hypothetical protein
MAKEELTGNLATESLIDYLDSLKVETNLNRNELHQAYSRASVLFG